MLKIRERFAARVILVHSACVHPETRYDRFGDEVCCDCSAIVAFDVATPNEGCERRSAAV